MKRLVAVALVLISCTMLFEISAIADEIPHIYYEQVVSGEYYGSEFEVNAIAVPMQPYYNLTHFWSVEKEDGTFEIVDRSEVGWCLSEGDYEKSSKIEKKAIDNQESLTLRVRLLDDGTPRIREFWVRGMEGYEDRMEDVVFWGYIAIAICACALLFLVPIKQNKSTVRKKEPQAIKTRFIDSSYTTQSRVKTGSAVGRAAVGSLIAGSVGAMVGAGTAKHRTIEHHTTTFMVYYDNDSRKVETVKNGTYKYNKYMELLDMGD